MPFLPNSNNGSQSVLSHQTCINKLCALYNKSNEIYDFNKNYFCNDCLDQYNKQYYCLYCKQIYFEDTDDGKNWIMCDQCEKWIHLECADYNASANINGTYKCIKCKKVETPQNTIVKNRKVINGGMARYGGLGPKLMDRRRSNECNLNNFGFYWQLQPQQLAEDMQKLKMYLN